MRLLVCKRSKKIMGIVYLNNAYKSKHNHSVFGSIQTRTPQATQIERRCRKEGLIEKEIKKRMPP